MKHNIWRVLLVVGLLAVLVTVLQAADSADAAASREQNAAQGIQMQPSASQADPAPALIQAGDANDGATPSEVESSQATAGAAVPAHRPAVETVGDTPTLEQRDAMLSGVNLAPSIQKSDQPSVGPYPGTESVPGGGETQ